MVEINMRAVESVQLTLKSRFKFRCHPGVPCFTQCCAKTNIILGPYDILRLKQRLRLNSGDFLARYTYRDLDEKSGFPIVVLDLKKTPDGRCPFVSYPEGCHVYSDRPGTCRYYPIGQGTLNTEAGLEEFYFCIKEDHCRGFEEEAEWTVASWRANQGVDLYDEMNREWKAMMLRRDAAGKPALEERTKNLFYMVAYDLDQFRRFVFKSRFLKIFRVEDDVQEKIWDDDQELLKFGYKYLKMVLRIEDTMETKMAVGPGPEAKTVTF